MVKETLTKDGMLKYMIYIEWILSIYLLTRQYDKIFNIYWMNLI